jgi:hypothetical protein
MLESMEYAPAWLTLMNPTKNGNNSSKVNVVMLAKLYKTAI